MMLFESVLISDLGARQVHRAVERLDRLGRRRRHQGDRRLQEAAHATPTRTATRSTGPTREKLVMDGKAGYQLMGDWEAADLDAKGFKDYSYSAVPRQRQRLPVAGRLVRAAQGREEPRRHEVLAEDRRQRRGPEGLQHQEGLDPGPHRRRRRPTTRPTSRPPSRTGRADTRCRRCAHGSACSQGWQGAVNSAMGKFSTDGDADRAQTALVAAAAQFAKK